MGTSLKTAGFALLAILGRVLFYIVTPLWLDYFRFTTSPIIYVSNVTNHTHSVPVAPGRPPHERINVIFLLVGQWGVSTLVFGVALGVVLIHMPGTITNTERTYSKRYIFLSGVSQGISSILMNFAMSGARTAPYLQALLPNFNIPVQFLMRFILLRKPPTFLKAGCAAVVLLSEIVCLLPTIFPSLQSEAQRLTDGGATGVGRVLWPLSIVMSLIPYAIANTLMEKVVQDTKPSPSSGETSRINLIYYLFWWCLSNTLTLVVLFWVDLVPGFGTSSSITDFGQSFWFSVRCQVGAAGCGPGVYMLGWLNFLANLTVSLAFPGLMRYSDGANFVMIVLALRTPIVFLFWTLFQEHPFQWLPHVSVSTWLSVGALCVALPAVVIYKTGLPKRGTGTLPGNRRPLLEGQGGERRDIYGPGPEGPVTT